MHEGNPPKKIKKVLVIDDNEMDLFIVNEYIEDASFAEEIILLKSAPKALELLKELENNKDLFPKIIFLDIRMPIMDGFEFLEEYQKFSDLLKSSCTIIMLSSSMDPFDHERAANNPLVHRLLNKPLDEEILNKLKKEFC